MKAESIRRAICVLLKTVTAFLEALRGQRR